MSTEMKYALEIKCKWLYLLSIKNRGNVEYKREGIHIPNVLRFWVEMWCLSLLDVLDV